MTFLNATMLFGLTLVALPVLLHLLNRGRGHTVPWGAMDFLLRSIALRKRRIRIEEALLLALRCLLLVLLVLAMARPFLPSRGNVSWLVLVLMFGTAAIFAGMAGALWDQRRARRILVSASILLLALAVTGTVMERWLQTRWWSFGGGERDLAILVDGSAAMALPYDDNHTLFEQAMTEARELADGIRPGDTVVVMIGASAPIPLIARPTSDRREIAAAFDGDHRHPPGGRFAVAETLNAAVTALAKGSNPHKTMILVGAGHRAGLIPEQSAQWDFLVNRMEALLPARPDLMYRRLQPQTGREIRNLAVSPPRLSRRLADTARPIRIETEIVNTGVAALSPGRVELTINDEKVDQRALAAEIPAGAAETIMFTHQFTQPGPHRVMVSLTAEDDIAADNTAVRIVHVEDRLPVLIVDGAPATRRLRSAASFVTIALDPAEDEHDGLLRRVWAFARGDSNEPEPVTSTERANLVQPDVRSITDLGAITDLRKYRAAILVNVPLLPDEFVFRLADAVRQGLGLWIVPGHLSRAEHFDQWRSAAGEPLWPAAPDDRVTLGRHPVGPQIRSFTHPAHRLPARDRHSDADALRVRAYWRLKPDVNDPNVRKAGILLNGDPFMLERSFGKGSVMMSAFMLDRQDSNLPSLKAFVPLVHETLYYLVGATMPDDNTQPGREFTTTVAFDPRQPADAGAQNGHRSEPLTVPVVAPSGRELSGRIVPVTDGLRVVCADTVEPGLYRLELPPELAERSVSNRLAGMSLSFAVLSDPYAAVIEPLTESDERRLNEYLTFFVADSADHLSMVLAEEVPGNALWPWFMVAALTVFLGEIAVSRLITLSRQTDAAAPVAFDAGSSDASEFKSKVAQWFPNRPT